MLNVRVRIMLQYGCRLTNVSRGPELSGHQTLTNSPVPLTGAGTANAACSSGPETISSLSSSVEEHAGTSTIRRKGSLVPTLPITTQTTRLISQQSRSGADDVDGAQRTDNHRLSDLPPPPTSANTVTADPRILSNHSADNGTSRSAAKAPPTSGHRLPAAAASTLPRDATLPPISAVTSTIDPRLTTASSHAPSDNGANWPNNRAPANPAHRPSATTHVAATSTRAVDGAGHGSPARSKPAPPKRSETTKLSTPDPRQTKAFIMNLDRVITQKNFKGSGGLATLPVPLPPRPTYVEGPTYLDTDDLPPPPAELLEGLRSMRRQGMPLPPIPAPGRR